MSRDQYDPMLHIAESLASIAVSLEKIANPMITLTPPTLLSPDSKPRLHITSYSPGRCEVMDGGGEWVSVLCNRHKDSPPRTEFPVET